MNIQQARPHFISKSHQRACYDPPADTTEQWNNNLPTICKTEKDKLLFASSYAGHAITIGFPSGRMAKEIWNVINELRRRWWRSRGSCGIE